eukprot:CAMPEP_0195028124 /NCGR_PEP_ID=MMETSP0326_2-20130528/53779_1 /TAXON_ID=2866 ORGANISM="Crypthecodinium cohnii, Strain Seligo" /NCGR_SAMPLE_ID=MMETSP0326_2 /ASSEMBLY_ACC=CAM_ASM_000348 /LENGTH=44 /DNA_ID= /DNA_START= /DNA_END= /DNA_ORIENTATION=
MSKDPLSGNRDPLSGNRDSCPRQSGGQDGFSNMSGIIAGVLLAE